MLFNSPLSPAKAGRLVELLDVSPGTRVLDAGCGRGEFLIRVIEATGAHGLGIDLEEESIAAARAAAADRVPAASHEFRTGDLQRDTPEDTDFDAAICLGSTHAFGAGDAAYPNALDELSRLVRPGGRLLIGEGYWKQPPAREYLDLIGEPVGIYRDHAGNVSFGEARGLVPLFAAVSNEDEWDHFEWSHKMRIELEAAGDPGDPAQAERLRRSRAWRGGYLRWGRSTMGFGFYLFRKPSDRT